MKQPKLVVVSSYANSLGFWPGVWSFVEFWGQKPSPTLCVYPKDILLPKIITSKRSMRMIPYENPADVHWDERPTLVVTLPHHLDSFLEPQDTGMIWAAPHVESCAAARQIKNKMIAQGLSREQIRLVVYNHGIGGALDAKMLSSQLGWIDAHLPYDEDLIFKSELEGELFQTLKPRSKLTVAMQMLTHKIVKEMAPAARPSSSHHWKDIERHVLNQFWRSLNDLDVQQMKSSSQVESLIDRELNEVLLQRGQGAWSPEQIRLGRKQIQNQIMGYGPLEKLLADTDISEIMVNGYQNIFVEKSGRLLPMKTTFINEMQFRVVIDRMVSDVGRRVDASSPLCDARMRDGARINVVLPPVSLNGPVLTIRRFKSNINEMDDLIREGSISSEMAEQLIRCVKARDNILIAGNSGAGKTTLLNILSGFIEESERIITIEDAAELKLQQKHVVRLETKMENIEGMGSIQMTDLVKNGLRMRPDRLIVGEVRGGEAIPMLQAMNTGHRGSMSTIHANSAMDALNRLEGMIMLGAPQWPKDVVRQMIGSGFQIIVFLQRLGNKRNVAEVRRIRYERNQLGSVDL